VKYAAGTSLTPSLDEETDVKALLLLLFKYLYISVAAQAVGRGGRTKYHLRTHFFLRSIFEYNFRFGQNLIFLRILNILKLEQ